MISTPANIETIFNGIKSRFVGRAKNRREEELYGTFNYPESVRDITVSNLNSTLEWYYENRDRFPDMTRKSLAQVAKEQADSKAKADAQAAEAERIRQATDPILKAKREQQARDAEIADEKAWIAEIERPLQGENEFNRLRRVAGLKEERERKRYPRPVPSSTPHADTLRRTAADTKLRAADQDAFLARKFAPVTSPEPTPTNFTVKK